MRNIKYFIRINQIFALRDAKGEWYPTKVITVDNKLVLEADKVAEPVAYGQAKNPPICLFSEAGFPAPPFVMQLTPYPPTCFRPVILYLRPEAGT